MLGALAFTALLVPFASLHVDREKPCEFNPGLLAEFRVADSDVFSVVAGGYRNSYCRTTMTAQVVAMPVTLGPVKLGASLGVGSGYDSPVIGAFQARIGEHLNLSFIPPTGPNTGVIGASLRIPF